MATDHSRKRPGRKPVWPPTMRLHKPSGRAIIKHRGKVYYLGKFGSDQAAKRYREITAAIAEAAVIDQPVKVPPKASSMASAMAAPRGGKKERNAWGAMRRRCYNPLAAGYTDYGGRGIWVCPRWLGSFDAFMLDLGAAPSPDHSLDRIDNDIGYTCGECDDCRTRGAGRNCRWATRHVQSRNKRSTRRLTYLGQTATLTDWARMKGISARTLAARLDADWSIEMALNTPSGRNRKFEFGLLSEFAWR